MLKSRKVHPFEKRLRLLEEALEQRKQKMDETDGEDLEERVSGLESNYKDLDSRHEELSEKVEDHEGQLADAMTVWRLENGFPHACPQPSASWQGY